MDTKKLLDDLIGVASLVAPLVPYGTPALNLGRKVVELVDNVKDTAAGDEAKMAELVAKRDELEAAMNEHVDRTVAALRG